MLDLTGIRSSNYMQLKCDIIRHFSNMLLKIDQIDQLLLVPMAIRLYFLCTAAMFVGMVEPEERSHANETSYSDTYTASLEKREGEGERKGGREGGRERGGYMNREKEEES